MFSSGLFFANQFLFGSNSYSVSTHLSFIFVIFLFFSSQQCSEERIRVYDLSSRYSFGLTDPCKKKIQKKTYAFFTLQLSGLFERFRKKTHRTDWKRNFSEYKTTAIISANNSNHEQSNGSWMTPIFTQLSISLCSQQCNIIHFGFVVVYLHHAHTYGVCFAFLALQRCDVPQTFLCFCLVKWLDISVLYVICVLNATLPQFIEWNQMFGSVIVCVVLKIVGIGITTKNPSDHMRFTKIFVLDSNMTSCLRQRVIKKKCTKTVFRTKWKIPLFSLIFDMKWKWCFKILNMWRWLSLVAHYNYKSRPLKPISLEF